jgi:hypothetical protein
MVTIDFTPLNSFATLTLPLEDVDSQPKNGSTARIAWEITVASVGKIRLSTGGTLNEMTGRVFVAIGDASPLGKTRRDDGEGATWGALYYFERDFNLRLYVSRKLFERLLHLAEIARIPSIEITFDIDEPGIKYRDVAYFADWDNVAHNQLNVAFCKLQTELVLPKMIREANDGKRLAKRHHLPIVATDRWGRPSSFRNAQLLYERVSLRRSSRVSVALPSG